MQAACPPGRLVGAHQILSWQCVPRRYTPLALLGLVAAPAAPPIPDFTDRWSKRQAVGDRGGLPGRGGEIMQFDHRVRRRRQVVVMAAAGAALCALQAHADTIWTNAGGDQQWSNNANWSANEPTAAVDATLPSPIPAGGGTITLSAGE